MQASSSQAQMIDGRMVISSGFRCSEGFVPEGHVTLGDQPRRSVHRGCDMALAWWSAAGGRPVPRLAGQVVEPEVGGVGGEPLVAGVGAGADEGAVAGEVDGEAAFVQGGAGPGGGG